MTKQASVHSCYYYNGSFYLESLSVIFLFVSLLLSAPPPILSVIIILIKISLKRFVSLISPPATSSDTTTIGTGYHSLEDLRAQTAGEIRSNNHQPHLDKLFEYL